jgi:hypothetical protein
VAHPAPRCGLLFSFSAALHSKHKHRSAVHLKEDMTAAKDPGPEGLRQDTPSVAGTEMYTKHTP